MTGAEQAALAARLRDALHAAGYELATPHREAGRGYYVEGNYVAAVGWLIHGGYVLREREYVNFATDCPAPVLHHLAAIEADPAAPRGCVSEGPNGLKIEPPAPTHTGPFPPLHLLAKDE